MGRFASSVKYYQRYREPYPAELFRRASAQMGLTGRERLADLGCGPAPLALGFAPFVGSCTGVDPEPEMIAAAAACAREAGVSLQLVAARMEEFTPGDGPFDLITIGRALHWFDRKRGLAALERMLCPNGWIAVCVSVGRRGPLNRWMPVYNRIRRSYANEPREFRYFFGPESWFRGSRFRKVAEIRIRERRRLKVADLIGHALSLSTTSPQALAGRRWEFERALREGLAPFAQDGVLLQEYVGIAELFQ